MSGPIGAWCRLERWPGKPWWPLCWRMLFCKNLEETRSLRCGGISTTMPDKSTRSESAKAAATETPQAPSAARKIYRIVKYGDAILEKPTPPLTKVHAQLEQLLEHMC